MVRATAKWLDRTLVQLFRLLTRGLCVAVGALGFVASRAYGEQEEEAKRDVVADAEQEGKAVTDTTARARRRHLAHPPHRPTRTSARAYGR